MIEPEAVAQDLMGITDDQEGFGVQLLYRLFDGHDLPLLEGAHEYLLLLAAPGALTMEDGHPALQLVDETVQYGAGLFLSLIHISVWP